SLSIAAAGCGPDVDGSRRGPGGDDDGSAAADDGGGDNGDGGMQNGGGDAGNPGCANPLDQEGCGCNSPGATRACYTGPAATENKGACRDGTQSCTTSGEFSVWGPCTGDVKPTTENCMAKNDENC